MKISLIGSNGAIGQPLALLLASSHKVNNLGLYDVVNQEGNALDLSHIDTNCAVSSHENVSTCVEGSDIVVVTVGLARKPGMTRDDLLKINAGILSKICNDVADKSPNAMLAIVTNPVNMLVPIACNNYQSKKLDTRGIFGVSTLDIMRANRFLADKWGVDPTTVFCPVVGGHSPNTMVPLISQAKCSASKKNLSSEGNDAIIKKVQEAGTDIINAKDKGSKGSASLSMAYAAYKFVMNLISAKSGNDVNEYSYVDIRNFKSINSELKKYPDFMAMPLKIDNKGVKEVLSMEDVTGEEQKLLDIAIKTLEDNIKTGNDFKPE